MYTIKLWSGVVLVSFTNKQELIEYVGREGVDLRSLRFDGLDLRGAVFNAAYLDDIVFERCDMRGCKFVGCDGGEGVYFEYTNLMDTVWEGGVFSGRFLYVNCKCSKFYNCDMSDTEWLYCNLRGCKFEDCDLLGSVYEHCEYGRYRDCKLSIRSHEFIANLLLNAAKSDEQRKTALLIGDLKELCWKDLLIMDDPEKKWAIGVLKGLGYNLKGGFGS